MNKVSATKEYLFNKLFSSFLHKLFERPDRYSLKYYHRKKKAEDFLKSL
ncbi:MAG: hypothetical protein KIT80_22700 [Chitinophagaceae bacterium]|nr:hypothetical protein [Chitinophagaceae bacterium]MCW5929747.1 hypothetical protein [Chitinophagaceae bacterium]